VKRHAVGINAVHGWQGLRISLLPLWVAELPGPAGVYRAFEVCDFHRWPLVASFLPELRVDDYESQLLLMCQSEISFPLGDFDK